MSTTSNTYNDPTTQQGQQKPITQQAYEGASTLASAAATTLQGVFNTAANATGYGGTTGVTNEPTTAYRNQQPHIGGVGDLGTTSETDVTRLPEERANPRPYTQGAMDLSVNDPAVRDPLTIQNQLNARDPPVPYPQGTSGVGVPADSQFRNQQSHAGGVGDLGTTSAADVARLPEERANPNPLGGAGLATGMTGDRDTANWKGATDFSHDQYRRENRQPGEEHHLQSAPDVIPMGGSTNKSATQQSGDPNYGTGNTYGTGMQQHHAAGVVGDLSHGRDHGHGHSSNDPNWKGATDLSAKDYRREDRQPGEEHHHHHHNEPNVAGATTQTGHQHDDHKHEHHDHKHGEDKHGLRSAGTLGDITHPAHSGGMTGSNHDNDHGLGMSHRDSLSNPTDRTSTTDRTDRTSATDRTSTTAGRHHVDTDTTRHREHDDDETASPTSAGVPTKKDKIKGSILIAKGKLTRDQETIEQGQNLKTTGQAVIVDQETIDKYGHKGERNPPAL